MPRSTSPTLEEMLLHCETQSTVFIKLRDATPFYFCTGDEELELDGSYQTSLLHVGELKESLGQSTNRIETKVSNVDKQFGLNIASGARKTELADVVIKRFYRDEFDPDIYEHRHFFTGKAVNAEVNEQFVSFDVIPDTTAAGTCIATETLTANNGWIFPEVPEQDPPGSIENPGGIGGHHQDPNDL